MSDEEPRMGDIAVCSRGCVGVIIEDSPKTIMYGNGARGLAWIGVKVAPASQVGDPWCSRDPVILGHRTEVKEGESVTSFAADRARLLGVTIHV